MRVAAVVSDGLSDCCPPLSSVNMFKSAAVLSCIIRPFLPFSFFPFLSFPFLVCSFYAHYFKLTHSCLSPLRNRQILVIWAVTVCTPLDRLIECRVDQQPVFKIMKHY